MTFTYVWRSDADGNWHTGSTRDLRSRLRQYAEGRVRSTASRRPWRMVYYAACVSSVDAFRRERFLADFFGGLRDIKLERH